MAVVICRRVSLITGHTHGLFEQLCHLGTLNGLVIHVPALDVSVPICFSVTQLPLLKRILSAAKGL